MEQINFKGEAIYFGNEQINFNQFLFSNGEIYSFLIHFIQLCPAFVYEKNIISICIYHTLQGWAM